MQNLSFDVMIKKFVCKSYYHTRLSNLIVKTLRTIILLILKHNQTETFKFRVNDNVIHYLSYL